MISSHVATKSSTKLFLMNNLLSIQQYRNHSLRKKCPYLELFWSVFSRIRTEYGEILRISAYSVWMREITPNMDTFYAIIVTLVSRILLDVGYRIPSIIFFAHAMFYWFFALAMTLIVILVLFWITLSIIKFTSTFALNMIYKCF